MVAVADTMQRSKTGALEATRARLPRLAYSQPYLLPPERIS